MNELYQMKPILAPVRSPQCRLTRSIVSPDKLAGRLEQTYHDVLSALVLLPKQNVGFFVACNSASAASAVLNTISLFMDHYYPLPKAPAVAPSPTLTDAIRQYTGTFFPTRSEYTTAGKLVGLFQSIRVVPQGEHQLRVSLGFPAQLSWLYTEIAPAHFRSADVPPTVFGDLVFRRDDQGNMAYLFQQNNPTTAYRKAPWYATPGFNLLLLGGSLPLFLSTLIWWPIGASLHRRFQVQTTSSARLAGGIAILASGISLGFMVGFVLIFASPQIVFGLPPWGYALFWLPLVIAICAIGMVAFTLMA